MGEARLRSIVAFKGNRKTIEFLLSRDGQCESQTFFDALDASDKRKLDVLFEMMGQNGEIKNKEKFKKIEGSDGIFEFKSFQIRLLCFFAGGGRLIICKGLRKKTDRHKRSDIEFAEKCRLDFLKEDSG